MIYQKVTGKEIDPDVKISVLFIMTGSIKAIITDILHHMTTAARIVIAVNGET